MCTHTDSGPSLRIKWAPLWKSLHFQPEESSLLVFHQSLKKFLCSPHKSQESLRPCFLLHKMFILESLLLQNLCHCSVTKSCLTLCDPIDCSMPGFPVLHYLPEFAQTHVHWGSDAIQPSHPLSPLLHLPSIFPSIRVFSDELAPLIRWPEYWSFRFSISPSNEYSGLISFRIDFLKVDFL